MVAIVLPSRWRTVPEYPVEIAPEWRDLVAFASLSGSASRQDIVSGVPPVITGSITHAGTPWGMASKAGTTASRLGWAGLTPFATFDAGYSLLVVAAPVATATIRRALLLGSEASSAFNQIGFGFNSAANVSASSGLFAVWEYHTSVQTRAQSIASQVDGNWHVFSAYRAPGSSVSIRLYRDGADVSGSTFSGTSQTLTAGISVNGHPGGSQGAVDPQLLAVVFNVKATPAHLQAIRTPEQALQLFVRRKARIYSFPSGAGNNYTLAGAVTHTLTPAATFTINRQHSIAGAVALTLTPSATFDIDRAHSLTGAVTHTLTPAASMAYTAAGTAAITGDVTYTLTPAATFAINRAYTLTGAVSHTLSVAAAMQYTAQQAIEFVGSVTYTLTPQAAMVGPAVVTTTPQVGGWYFPKVKRNDWRERSAKERREYLERLLDAAESAPEDVREEVEEIIESVTGREEVANVTRIEVARINKLIARIERALEDEDETVLLLLSA